MTVVDQLSIARQAVVEVASARRVPAALTVDANDALLLAALSSARLCVAVRRAV